MQRQVKQAGDGTQKKTRRGNRSKKDLPSDTSSLEPDEAGGKPGEMDVSTDGSISKGNEEDS